MRSLLKYTYDQAQSGLCLFRSSGVYLKNITHTRDGRSVNLTPIRLYILLSKEVQLLFEADCIIRNFVPVVFDAAGWSDVAQRLRTLPPLENSGAIVAAFEFLDSLQCDPPNEAWAEAIEDCCFWCEAAIWAAIEDNNTAFEEYLSKARQALIIEFRPVSIH